MKPKKRQISDGNSEIPVKVLRKLDYAMGNPIFEKDIEIEEDIVGTGTYSKVYKGTYLKQTVAVKIFRVNVSDEHFEKEVKILRNLNHNKIVKFLGYCSSGRKEIVMEYMERGTLFDILHKELYEFTWLEKLRIIKQVTEAMKYLHSMQIAHCDLSSKNLLV
jgi:serine/threonine protein kinase